MGDSTQPRQRHTEYLAMASPAVQAAPQIAGPQAVRAQRAPIADGYADSMAYDDEGPGAGVISTSASADTGSHFVHLHNNLRQVHFLPPAIHTSTADENSMAPAAAAFLAPSSAGHAHPPALAGVPEEQGGYGARGPLQYLSGSKRGRVCWEMEIPGASYPQTGGALPCDSAVQPSGVPRTGGGGLHLGPSMSIVQPAAGGAGEMYESGGGNNVGGHVGGLRLQMDVRLMSGPQRAMEDGSSGGGNGAVLNVDDLSGSFHVDSTRSAELKDNVRTAPRGIAATAATGPIESNTTNQDKAAKSRRQRSADDPPLVCAKEGGTSRFRGVTRHCKTGKWEAHLWDSTVARKKKGPGGRTRGKQVFLGGFGSEMEAARAYDLASIVFRREEAYTNFCLDEYAGEMTALEKLDKDSVVAMLRRRSTGFSRGASHYRGVTRHHQPGKWEARIGKVAGGRYMYLGCFDKEEAAAMAYDYAALRRRGARAATNFEPATYHDQLNGALLPYTFLPQEVQSGIAPSSLSQLQGPPDSSTEEGAGSSDDDDADLRLALGITAIRVSDAGAASSGQQAASAPLPSQPQPPQLQHADRGFTLAVPDPQSASGAGASGVGAGGRRLRSGLPQGAGAMLGAAGEVSVTDLDRSDHGGGSCVRGADTPHGMGRGPVRGGLAVSMGASRHDMLLDVAGAPELNRHGSLIPGAGAPTAMELTLATAADGRPNAPTNAAPPPPPPPANLQPYKPHLPSSAVSMYGEQTGPYDNANEGPYSLCPLFHMPRGYGVHNCPVRQVPSDGNIQGMVTPNHTGTGEMRLEDGGAGSNSGFEGGGVGYSMNTEMDPNGASGTLLSADICLTGTKTSYTATVADGGDSGGGMPCTVLNNRWQGSEGGGATAVLGPMHTPDPWPQPPNYCGMMAQGGEPSWAAGSPWSLGLHPNQGSGTHLRPVVQDAMIPYPLYGMKSPGGPVGRCHAASGSQVPWLNTAAAIVAHDGAGQHGVQQLGNMGPQSMSGGEDRVCGSCGALGCDCGPGCGGGNWLADTFLEMGNVTGVSESAAVAAVARAAVGVQS